jgi:hypothetical protein
MYKVGYNAYGIEILRVHREFIRWNYRINRWQYFGNCYYTKYNKRLWFFEEYQLNSLVSEQQIKCMQAIRLAHKLKIKLMLD